MRRGMFLFIVLAMVLCGCGKPGAGAGPSPSLDAGETAAADETPAVTPTSEPTPSPTPELTVAIEQPEGLTEEIVAEDNPAAPQSADELTDEEKDAIAVVGGRFDANLLYEIDLGGSTDKSGAVKYDFNGDDMIETLSYTLTRGEDSELLVVSLGNSRIECLLIYEPVGAVNNFRALGICDVDKGDGVIDFFITKVSYNGIFETTSIYRLGVDNDIVALAGLDTGISGVSGDGKVYYWGGNLKETYKDNFNPDYVLTYYDIARREYVDTDQIMGKTFTDMGGFLLFANHEDVPTGGPVEMTDDLPGVIRRLEPGEALTILDVPRDDTAQVRTEGGETGWVGGFHMVWD